jgi:tetraacyldisaccharide 4'-kinase
MNPLSAIFAAGVALRNAAYERGVFKVRKLARPVVSVGNISVGGSGKTPFVIALGQLLKERGIEFDVLSRGYGRSSRAIAVVDPNGSPTQFGDEPILIARKLSVPVIVGNDRYQVGRLAEQRFASKLHLLDDGFQHRRLHRDFDIVMLPASDLEESLLPVGRLREPLSSLRRADVAVLSPGESKHIEAASFVRDHSDSLDTVERVMEFEEKSQPSLHVLAVETWRIRRNTYLDAAPGKPLAFCGIARPQQFFAQLRDLGIQLDEAVSFPDHHRYTESDVARLQARKASTGAAAFITTEKDAINLGLLAGRLQPLRVAQLRLMLEDPDQALSTLLSTLERRCGCRF